MAKKKDTPSEKLVMGSPEQTLRLTLKGGVVTIQLRPDWAPNHVKRIRELVREGFYDGLPFHRVIDGFMAQTGDPDGTGNGGSGKRIKAEFNDANHDRGTCSMARTMDINSADSQWFICFRNSPFLDGQYTAWGRVSAGMEHVDAIARGEPPATPDTIIRMEVMADVA